MCAAGTCYAATGQCNGTPFEKVAGPLQPGQHDTITMTVPISGPDGLAITKPGVYPMLINIDGTPDYGRQARLATDSVLLPVRSVPGSSTPNPGGNFGARVCAYANCTITLEL